MSLWLKNVKTLRSRKNFGFEDILAEYYNLVSSETSYVDVLR